MATPSPRGRSRRSVTKPNKEDKSQTTLKKFFNVVSKDEQQEKFKAILGNESGSDLKEDLKEHEKENGGDTKNVGYVKVFRKWNTCRLWQYGLWSFQTGDTKLETFLPKNQHTQSKLLNFENCVNGEVSKSAKISKSIFYGKNHQNLSEFLY